MDLLSGYLLHIKLCVSLLNLNFPKIFNLFITFIVYL